MYYLLVCIIVIVRVSTQLHSPPGEDSSDEITHYQRNQEQEQDQQERCGRAVDTDSVLPSKRFNVFRPLASRHAVLIRVATATLHTAAAVSAEDRDLDGGARREIIRLVDRKQSTALPSVTEDEDGDIVDNSPSDDEWPASMVSACDTSTSPSPRRSRPPITVPGTTHRR